MNNFNVDHGFGPGASMLGTHKERRYRVRPGLLSCLQAVVFFAFCSLLIRIGVNYIQHSPLLNLPIVPVEKYQKPANIPEGYLKVFPKPEPEMEVSGDVPPEDPSLEEATTRADDPTLPYTIQLVTYMSEARATEEVEQLRGRGRAAYIIPSGEYYQVCIEHFAEKLKAHETMNELERQGILETYRDAYVRPVRR